MKVKEHFPMRNWIVAAVVGFSCSSLYGSPRAVEQVKISNGVGEACQSLADAQESDPVALIIDTARLGDLDTSRLLDAIADLRIEKRRVFALCAGVDGKLEDGASIVALACDATILLAGTNLMAPKADWCQSPTRAARIELALVSLGQLDARLASRFLKTDSELAWSRDREYAASSQDPGAIVLAQPEQPVSLAATTLRDIGVAAPVFNSVADAVRAIESGAVQPRTKPTMSASKGQPGRRTTTGGSNVGRPSGSPGGSGTSGGVTTPSTPPAASPSAPTPAAPKSTPAPTATAPINEAKLAEEVAEYNAALGELKGLLREFNDYYRGIKGTWSSPNKGLKWVWEDRSDHTEHKDTKMICQRLQRDIKTQMSTLESCLKTVERLVKDKEHPEVVRMKANVPALDGLRAGFERNKVSNYETYYGQVMSLK
jgi:hypothetical protein